MTDDPIAFLVSSRSENSEARQPHLWPLIMFALALMAVAVGFFGGRNGELVVVPSGSTTPDRESRIYTVSYRFGAFSPTNLRIHAGDTVRFRNDSPLPIRIIAQLQSTARTPEFDSVGKIQTGSYFSYTFANVGVFGYYNYDSKDESAIIIVR